MDSSGYIARTVLLGLKPFRDFRDFRENQGDEDNYPCCPPRLLFCSDEIDICETIEGKINSQGQLKVRSRQHWRQLVLPHDERCTCPKDLGVTENHGFPCRPLLGREFEGSTVAGQASSDTDSQSCRIQAYIDFSDESDLEWLSATADSISVSHDGHDESNELHYHAPEQQSSKSSGRTLSPDPPGVIKYEAIKSHPSISKFGGPSKHNHNHKAASKKQEPMESTKAGKRGSKETKHKKVRFSCSEQDSEGISPSPKQDLPRSLPEHRQAPNADEHKEGQLPKATERPYHERRDLELPQFRDYNHTAASHAKQNQSASVLADAVPPPLNFETVHVSGSARAVLGNVTIHQPDPESIKAACEQIMTDFANKGLVTDLRFTRSPKDIANWVRDVIDAHTCSTPTPSILGGATSSVTSDGVCSEVFMTVIGNSTNH